MPGRQVCHSKSIRLLPVSIINELPAIFDLAVKLGAVSFHPFLLVPTGRGKELAEYEISPQEYEKVLNWIYEHRTDAGITLKPTCAPHYYRIFREREREAGRTVTRQTHGLDAMSKGCLGGQGFAFISYEGIVQMCGFLDIPAGNLKEEELNFQRIWEDSPFFHQIRNLESYKGKCGICEYRNVCGGCRARAFSATGDYLSEEPYCVYTPVNSLKGGIVCMNIKNFSRSKIAFEKALDCIPGGVNSPVRAFKGVGGTPPFIASGKGAYITDIDNNEYIDFVGSWGPLILGNAHPAVTEAIQSTMKKGLSFGAPTEQETELAQLIIALVPSVEMVRFVNSGTEATMSAVRVARGYTNRNMIVKFDGCYHGHADEFLIAAGSGAATLGIPDSPGVTPGTAGDTLLARFNDISSVQSLFEKHGKQIAAVIIEPIVGNMGVLLPQTEFLQQLRDITLSFGSLLIFDEVMTGFRVASGGTQELYGIKPDLTTFGKIIGGGLPVGAYGGSKKIMEMVAPSGPVYQAGTLSGNPLSISAGLATLRVIDSTQNFYDILQKNTVYLADGLMRACANRGINAVINRAGSMLTLFFSNEKEIADADSARKSDKALFSAFFHAMLLKGIYLPPSQFEASFLSFAHTTEDLDRTIEAASEALASLKR